MVHFKTLAGLLALAVSTDAWSGPNYSGFWRVWQDTFDGASGSAPSGGNWHTITGDLGYNGELETYTNSNWNVQLSGGATLQIVPWRSSSAKNGWTSARLESWYTFTPAGGKVTRAEAQIRFGNNSIGNKQGIWPAFWMLGDSLRHGTGWPANGEIDILETINGQLTGYGTLHCDKSPGGICNEGNGIGGSIGIPDQGWHTWRVDIDRRPGDWTAETITWFMDGRQFHQISGGRIGNYNVWNAVAHSPMFFILNVAVGGNWPGYPNGNTQDGYGSMMEVAYVAVYST
ncbi:endo-1,3(4)-beta-glucanase [Purpureocillium lavendulum]|uniref:Endo-1,3(4)-beta-glucanase n=1 Tax=Purpureocillium lavendulum TaxID=1247861 RepID=A0AB34FQE3_9HYPO|nr:endo-1,3(4)-beta-glucanase [Purpureocillium lavendulum]